MRGVDAIGEEQPWNGRDAQIEAWRCILAVLAGDPVPSVAPAAAQGTIEALAREAAVSIACRFQEIAAPILAGMVRNYAEGRLARLVLADLATAGDPPGPLAPD
jgi:hypothetical protein